MLINNIRSLNEGNKRRVTLFNLSNFAYPSKSKKKNPKLYSPCRNIPEFEYCETKSHGKREIFLKL